MRSGAPDSGAPSSEGGLARHRVLLLGVIGVQIVGDTALAPYFPQLFRRLFDIDDLTATGTFLWVCRVTGLLALPLWALAARRWAPQRLVVLGLWGSAVLDLLLGLAPTWTAFTVVAALHVAVSSVLVLAYPLLVAASDESVRGVRANVALLHVALLGSAALGAGVLALPEPRVGIAAFAVLDAALAVAAGRLWRRSASTVTKQPGAARISRLRDENRLGVRGVLVAVLAVALLAGVVELGAGVVRPFFTEYALHEGASLPVAAGVFALPGVAALLVLPVAAVLHRRLGRRLLPTATALAACGLLVQTMAADLVTLSLGRVVFGAGLGLAQVALDLVVFAAVGTAGPGFVAVEWFRSAALVLTPVVATGAASLALVAPLGVGAAVFAVVTVVALVDGRRPPQPSVSGTQEVDHVLAPGR